MGSFNIVFMKCKTVLTRHLSNFYHLGMARLLISIWLETKVPVVGGRLDWVEESVTYG